MCCFTCRRYFVSFFGGESLPDDTMQTGTGHIYLIKIFCLINVLIYSYLYVVFCKLTCNNKPIFISHRKSFTGSKV